MKYLHTWEVCKELKEMSKELSHREFKAYAKRCKNIYGFTLVTRDTYASNRDYSEDLFYDDVHYATLDLSLLVATKKAKK